MANTNKFLNYAGLAKFWELIKGKFVANVAVGTDSAVFKDANGKELFTISGATTTQAGLMTSADKVKLEAVSGNIEAAIDIKGVAFGGNAATIATVGAGDNAKIKHVNLDVRYNSENKKIEVVDLNNSSAVLTSFDATAFIKDGMLDSADIISKDGKAFIQLTWNTDSGKDVTDIDVSDIIMPYAAGNGLNIVDGTNGKIFSVKVTDGEKYIAVDTTGVHTTEQLVTDYKKAAKDAADAAQTAAETALNTYKAEVSKKFEDYSTTSQVEGLIAPKADKTYVDDELAKKANNATTLAGYGITDAYTKTEVDATVEDINDAIAAIKGDNGSLAQVLADAKSYTDTEIAEVNKTIGTKAVGETPATGLYKEIADAQAAAEGKAAELVGDLADTVYTKDDVDGLIGGVNSAITDLDGEVAVFDTDKKILATLKQEDGKVSADSYVALTLDYISDFEIMTDDEITAIVNAD